MEWGNLIGIAPDHPLVGGGRMAGMSRFDPDAGLRRIVTTPSGQAGAATGGVMATPDGSGFALAQMDDWRDLFNFGGSPMPWLLLIALGIVLFAHASVQARAGAFGKSATASAAFK